MDFARDLFGGACGTGVEKIVADEVRCSCIAAQRSHVAQIFNTAICGATAEECALAVGRDVDVEKAGHCIAGALDPARVHAAFSEMFENVVAEAVAADATGEAHVDAPAGESQSGVCAYSAAVHFELGREAILAWLRPGFYAAEHVDVDIADDDDCRLWAGASGHVASACSREFDCDGLGCFDARVKWGRGWWLLVVGWGSSEHRQECLCHLRRCPLRWPRLKLRGLSS